MLPDYNLAFSLHLEHMIVPSYSREQAKSGLKAYAFLAFQLRLLGAGVPYYSGGNHSHPSLREWRPVK